jgi:hypothetical protein
VVRILDALNTQPQSTFLPRLLAAAAGYGSVDRAVFVPTEFHSFLPEGPFIFLIFVNPLKEKAIRGLLDALLASGYYRAGNCGSANSQFSGASRCGPTLPAMSKLFAATVLWSELTDSGMNPLAATPLSLVGGSVRPFFASLSSSWS